MATVSRPIYANLHHTYMLLRHLLLSQIVAPKYIVSSRRLCVCTIIYRLCTITIYACRMGLTAWPLGHSQYIRSAVYVSRFGMVWVWRHEAFCLYLFDLAFFLLDRTNNFPCGRATTFGRHVPIAQDIPVYIEEWRDYSMYMLRVDRHIVLHAANQSRQHPSIGFQLYPISLWFSSPSSETVARLFLDHYVSSATIIRFECHYTYTFHTSRTIYSASDHPCVLGESPAGMPIDLPILVDIVKTGWSIAVQSRDPGVTLSDTL